MVLDGAKGHGIALGTVECEDMSCSIANLVVGAAFVAIPSDVKWSYSVFAAVIVAGLVGIVARGDWQKARGLDKLLLFGPLFYAAPLAGFGTEHFTQAQGIASIVPAWIPWHLFWAYFVGACFIAAGFSLVTRIQARLAASLVGLTFFLFVMLMDAPAWSQQPGNRIFAAIALRELAFSGGALALAASLSGPSGDRSGRILATLARYFVGVPVLVYAIEQFLHADGLPGVPLARLTPTYIPWHAVWAYVPAVVYVVAGILLVVGKKTRAAATWAGLAVLFVELVVYVPIAVVDRASLGNGFNYVADTLMFCGTVFLLAGAMPREESKRESLAYQGQEAIANQR